MPHGLKTSETFKIDTGADGNLMPITMFAKFFPKISLETLGKTIESGSHCLLTTTYLSSNLEHVVWKFPSRETEYLQVLCSRIQHHDYWTSADSEKLDLVKVNFDVIEKENSIKVVHNVESDSFKKQMKQNFLNCSKGIGCMDGEISIKLYNGVIPHTELIRQSTPCYAKPLKDELDKLCKEKILHKVDISKPIEWLNSFICVKNQMGKLGYVWSNDTSQ